MTVRGTDGNNLTNAKETSVNSPNTSTHLSHKNENQGVNKVAKEALNQFVEDSLVTRFLYRAMKGWKILTDTISEFFLRIFSVFTSALKEDLAPVSPHLNAQEHIDFEYGQPLEVRRSIPESSDMDSKQISFDEKKMLGNDSSPVEETPTQNEKPIAIDEMPTQENLQEEEPIAIDEMPTQENLQEEEPKAVIETLFHPIAELQQAVMELKLESYDDVRKAITLTYDCVKYWEVIEDIVDAIDLSTPVEHVEEANLQKEMLTVSIGILWKTILDNRKGLESLFQNAMEDEDLFACATLIWSVGLISESHISRIMDKSSSRITESSTKGLQQAGAVGLINKGRNACYRNAVNQMLAVSSFQEFVKDRFRESTKGLGKALLDLWACQYNPKAEPIHLLLSDERLLCDERLLGELCSLSQEPGRGMPGLSEATRYHQQDASEYMETIFNELDYKITVKQTLDGLDGQTVRDMSVDESAILRVGRFDKIEEAISNFLCEEVNDPRNPWKAEPDKSFAVYKKHFKIVDKPLEVLALNVKRKIFNEYGSYKIDDRPMVFPPDNVVDMSAAYGLDSGSIRYELQGFVWNISSQMTEKGESAGHYIGYRNINGTWYEFDDEKVTKIDRDANPKLAEEFERRKNQLILGLFVKV